MADLLLRNSTESPGESLKLLNLLETLESELEVSYLERRKRGNSHKSNPIEELQDAIQEITQRERDLQASIGISKVLLENNNKLLTKRHKLKQKNLNLGDTIRDQQQVIKRAKEELANTVEKYYDMNAALANSEAEYIKLQSEVKRKSDETVFPINTIDKDTMSIDKYEADINDISSKFKKEYEHLMSNS